MDAVITVSLDPLGLAGQYVIIKNPKALSIRKFRQLQSIADKPGFDAGLDLLRSLIESWSVKDEDGAQAGDPKDGDTIETVPFGVLMYVSDRIKDAMGTALPKESATQ